MCLLVKFHNDRLNQVQLEVMSLLSSDSITWGIYRDYDDFELDIFYGRYIPAFNPWAFNQKSVPQFFAYDTMEQDKPACRVVSEETGHE